MSILIVLGLGLGGADTPSDRDIEKQERRECSGKGETIWQLEKRVEECEAELGRKKCDLSEARARLALAHGKKDEAIREQLKAVGYYEARVQWLRKNIGRYCEPTSMIKTAEFDLAEAKVWLAEVQGQTETLIGELKKIVRFRQWQVRTVEFLLDKHATTPEELESAQNRLKEARDRLKAATK